MIAYYDSMSSQKTFSVLDANGELHNEVMNRKDAKGVKGVFVCGQGDVHK